MTSACRYFGNPMQRYSFLGIKKATRCRIRVAFLSPCDFLGEISAAEYFSQRYLTATGGRIDTSVII